MKKVLSFLAFLLLFFCSAVAQRNLQDVVYLKNGGLIRGLVFEQIPGVSLKIQTNDGSVFVYKMEEVEKITKETIIKGNQNSNSEWSYKEPVVSWLLSFLIPGVGQMYNGQVGKGLSMLFVYSGCIGMTAVKISGMKSASLTQYNQLKTQAHLFLGAAAITYLWSMIDAPVYASRKKREEGFAFKIGDNSQLTLAPSVDYNLIPNENGEYSMLSGIKLSLSF